MTARTVTALAFAFACTAAAAQDQFSAEQIKQGAQIYSQNCAPCHGPRMLDPNAAFDLRKFPQDQKSRFVASVSKGKNAMPPWGDLFKPEDMDALWAYVMAGEKP
jgi:mono/diheme cytochrome c family protein